MQPDEPPPDDDLIFMGTDMVDNIPDVDELMRRAAAISMLREIDERMVAAIKGIVQVEFVPPSHTGQLWNFDVEES